MVMTLPREVRGCSAGRDHEDCAPAAVFYWVRPTVYWARLTGLSTSINCFISARRRCHTAFPSAARLGLTCGVLCATLMGYGSGVLTAAADAGHPAPDIMDQARRELADRLNADPRVEHVPASVLPGPSASGRRPQHEQSLVGAATEALSIKVFSVRTQSIRTSLQHPLPSGVLSRFASNLLWTFPTIFETEVGQDFSDARNALLWDGVLSQNNAVLQKPHISMRSTLNANPSALMSAALLFGPPEASELDRLASFTAEPPAVDAKPSDGDTVELEVKPKAEPVPRSGAHRPNAHRPDAYRPNAHGRRATIRTARKMRPTNRSRFTERSLAARTTPSVVPVISLPRGLRPLLPPESSPL